MIKIGIRRNLRYPILFIVFTFSRRIVKYIMEDHCLEKKIKVPFLMIWFMIFFELILGIIYSCKIESPKKVKQEKNKTTEIKIIKTKKELKRPDGLFKIVLLMFFSGYFEIIGFLSRRLIDILSKQKDYDEFNARYRSLEICFSSILCFFTFRIKILRHQLFSLIIIILSLFIVFVIEFIINREDSNHSIYDFFSIVCTSISRAFLDTTEKYLFDIDFINIFKLIRFQSAINLLLMSLLYNFKQPRKEIKDLIDLGGKYFWKSFFSVFLLIIYAILTGYKNIYRRYTVKEYSPMTRSLSESVIDPFLIIFGFITNGMEINKSKLYIIGITIFSLIMVFSSCVYNEIFVLYCCGLQHNTHFEISKRAKSMELIYNERHETNIEIDVED